MQQLLLKIDGVRRNDRFLMLFQREQDRRSEIGERFPDAGAGLDHQMSIFLQRPRHRDRHFLLLRPVFEIFRLREQAILRKDCPNPFDKFRSERIFQRNHRASCDNLRTRLGISD